MDYPILRLSAASLVCCVCMTSYGTNKITLVTALEPNSSHLSNQTSDWSETFDSKRINGCLLTLEDPYIWRNWQPTIAMPGPDGGSPLLLSLDFTMVNLTSSEKLFFLKGWVKSGDLGMTRITLTNRRGLSQTIVKLKPDTSRRISVVSRDGPYVAIGSTAIVVLELETKEGDAIVVATRPGIVQEVH